MSLKVIPDYTFEYGMCKVLLVIHCRPKYTVFILYHCGYIQHRILD